MQYLIAAVPVGSFAFASRAAHDAVHHLVPRIVSAGMLLLLKGAAPSDACYPSQKFNSRLLSGTAATLIST